MEWKQRRRGEAVVHVLVGTDLRVEPRDGRDGRRFELYAGEYLLGRPYTRLGDAKRGAERRAAAASPKAPKQSTRMLKAACDACGMVLRTTRKWIDSPGLPTCACGGRFAEGGQS